MTKDKQKGLIPIVLERDIDQNYGYVREDTGQIVDKCDIDVLSEPPILFNNFIIPCSKIKLGENYEIPEQANALLLGKRDYKKELTPASYCILTERPDDGIRRLRG